MYYYRWRRSDCLYHRYVRFQSKLGKGVIIFCCILVVLMRHTHSFKSVRSEVWTLLMVLLLLTETLTDMALMLLVCYSIAGNIQSQRGTSEWGHIGTGTQSCKSFVCLYTVGIVNADIYGVARSAVTVGVRVLNAAGKGSITYVLQLWIKAKLILSLLLEGIILSSSKFKWI